MKIHGLGALLTKQRAEKDKLVREITDVKSMLKDREGNIKRQLKDADQMAQEDKAELEQEIVGLEAELR